MSVEEKTTERPLRQDIELSALASYAAVELDNKVLKRSTSTMALQRLSQELVEAIPPGKVQSNMLALYVPQAPIMFYYILRDSNVITSTKVKDVLEKAGEIIQKLKKVAELTSTDNKELIEMRSFCLALAKHARSTESIYSLGRPNNPFRK